MKPKSTRGLGRLGLVVVIALAALVGLAIGYSLRPSHERATAPAEATAPATTTTLYTCGMHPEIISDEPGYCPKCEMKLTPMDPDRAAMILAARGVVAQRAAPAGERKILYWRAPMDPTYIRNEPGKSPMGMDLVPVYEDEVSGGPTIRIDPVTEQNMGFRYDVVRVGPLEKTVRTVGTVTYDEQSLGTVTTKVDGWVEKLYVRETGTQVHAGDPLFELYSRELFSAQEEYLVALRDVAGQRAVLAQARLSAARERLRFFDISDEQINQIEDEGKIRKTLTITARLTGIITERHVVEGDFIAAGQPAYKIADLSNVWVMGRVYESDLPFVKLGQEALMQLDYLPGRMYRGRVTYIYPYLEPGTREIPVRMEFHNPGYELKPGMYATLRLASTPREQAVLAPATAILDTGERQVAFVLREPGKFEPRRVKAGLRSDRDEVEVLSGLAPGETVVVSGQFMLDSESRLREATLKMLSPGMVNTSAILESTTPSLTRGAAGDVPDATAPLRYVCPMPAHSSVLFEQPGDCPLCGMKLVPTHPWHDAGDPIDHYTCPMPEHYHVSAASPGKCSECGMTLIPVTKGEMERFEAAKKSSAPTLYTCPMASHAHIVSDQPGRCPECEMKLVPTSAVAHGKEAEAAWK
ncbi:efflux RND transporter periplasmic adaptor subunit [bacterium]|nr:efflux RND transporter periplasmic adaptor subunit [bacterium]